MTRGAAWSAARAARPGSASQFGKGSAIQLKWLSHKKHTYFFFWETTPHQGCNKGVEIAGRAARSGPPFSFFKSACKPAVIRQPGRRAPMSGAHTSCFRGPRRAPDRASRRKGPFHARCAAFGTCAFMVLCVIIYNVHLMMCAIRGVQRLILPDRGHKPAKLAVPHPEGAIMLPRWPTGAPAIALSRSY